VSNLLTNSSFEQDSNADGLADAWSVYGNPTVTRDTTKAQYGSASQQVSVSAGNSEDIRSAQLVITAGLPYTLSVYAWVAALNPAPAGQAIIKVEWYDNAGTLVNYDYTPLATLDSGFVRRSITSIPGTGAVTGRAILGIESGGTVNWDAPQLEQSASPSTYVDGPPAARTVNLVRNSSFEQDTVGDGLANGWTRYGNPTVSQDATQFLYGSVSQKMAGTAGAAEDIRFMPISVEAGLPYTLSVYAWVTALNPAPAGQVVVKIEWYDSNNTLTSYDYTVISATDTGFVRRSVTSTPTNGSITGLIILASENGGTVYWDAIQLEQATTPSAYVEGPPLVVSPGTNLIVNSGFEFDLNGDGIADYWGKYGNSPIISRDSGRVRYGSVSQKVVGPAGENDAIFAAPIGIVVGTPYTLSVYTWVDSLNVAPAGQAIIKIEWHDNDAVVLDYAYTFINTTDTGFVRHSVTATPPTGSVTGHVFLGIEGGGTVYWDAVQFEPGVSATAYVDGPAASAPIFNLGANTSFEWDSNGDGLADGWTKFGLPTTTIDTTTKNFGASSQKVIGAPGTNQAIQYATSKITAGKPYTFSIYSYVQALNTSPAGTVGMTIDWLDSNGTLCNTDTVTIVTPDSGFVRRSLVSTPAIGAETGRISLTVNQGGTVYFDDFQFEQASSMSARYLEPDWDWVVRSAYRPSDATGSLGAISWSIDHLHIRPYEASYAAIGCAAAGRTFGIQKFADVAWDWCAWYRDHMEPDGTMYDYDTPNSTMIKLSTRDSTDAYAGMYLQALYAAHTTTPRSLTSFGPSISKALDAIELTMQSDGLTWALPNYTVKYLEDQVETASGCYAAASLATVLGDAATASRATVLGDRMLNGIATLWNPQTPTAPAYDWAVNGSGNHDVTRWDKDHDVEQQLWAVAYGAADGTRANALLDQVNLSDPAWADQSVTGRYTALSVVAYQRNGRDAEANAGLYLYAARSQSNSRAWDWDPGYAGMAIIGRLGAMDLLTNLTVKKFISKAPSKILNSGSTWTASVRKVKMSDGSWHVA
jgi:hypothetical protein